ncbi:SMP-30/gluconolactonase/LRE family protein [Chryseobacterium sp. PTM-20240506]|uniref:SMP-30/gluconolactonase/LRE family protein n=1 Tax=unclassified Chryseobacterium TaxID=2593645 RepID=UPI002358C76E|nr:SMP-30/gluconolactonase/LRE family protein [Chryseobacterium sp. B21-037]MDC8102927.1 SMP-30/gluconolactonase/LRE family protein [Chryseobacterium sp. B21-037]MDC8107186.1 SMP-30/gluconolactonase/LRE family protein [Chryseobacterium sp. B21-037]WBV56382.1 SMP-30/gluconolactonase/LRE family protein [Chryseobacterium daecheongense]WBV56413.1 SMP-30/gluconolactonase/LRE family protein [Chryseobacterium daecheongense]
MCFRLAVTWVTLHLLFQYSYGQILNKPESVDFDPNTETYYISNIGGSSGGFIVVDSKKKTTEVKKEGKGQYLGIKRYGKYIICAIDQDNTKENGLSDEVALYDAKSYKLIKTISIPGAIQLNDIEVDERGVVYVTDRGANQVYEVNIVSGSFNPLLKENNILTPNGLFYDLKTKLLYICTTNETNNAIYILDPKSRKIEDKIAIPFSNLDGIIIDKNDNIYVSSWSNDWKSSRILKLGSDKKSISVLMENENGMADIAYDKVNNRILIACMYKNTIQVLHL